MTSPVLGLDIGGTKLAVGVVAPDGTVDRMLVEPTRREEGPQVVLDRLFDMGRRVSESSRWGAPSSVGISCGGPLDAAKGVLTCPPHLPGWIDIPVVTLARAYYGLPAFLENDATAAALAEFRFGAGRGASSLVYLTISTGVGGGAVLGGRLHVGAAGNGGELGHIMVRPGGRLCTCGRHGCLESYCSGTQIARRGAEAALAALEVGRSTTLVNLPSLTAADVSRAAADGDRVAREVWDETTALLGQGVTDLVNVFEPDVVVLGGGVTRSGAMLLDPVRAIVNADAMPPAARAVRVELAELGDAVGVVGAGAVAMDGLAALRADEPSAPHAAASHPAAPHHTASCPAASRTATLPELPSEEPFALSLPAGAAAHLALHRGVS